MKVSKIVLFLTLFMIAARLVVSAQTNNPASSSDDDFTVVLLLCGIIFVCGMIGAAIIGAMVATLLALLFVALLSAGILSTSIAVGLYKRSFSAAFKALLVIVFAGTCAAVGCGGLLVFNHFVPLRLVSWQVALAGGISGFTGGYLMAIASYQVIHATLKNVLQRFGLA